MRCLVACIPCEVILPGHCVLWLLCECAGTVKLHSVAVFSRVAPLPRGQVEASGVSWCLLSHLRFSQKVTMCVTEYNSRPGGQWGSLNVFSWPMLLLIASFYGSILTFPHQTLSSSTYRNNWPVLISRASLTPFMPLIILFLTFFFLRKNYNLGRKRIQGIQHPSIQTRASTSSPKKCMEMEFHGECVENLPLSASCKSAHFLLLTWVSGK